MGRGKNARRGKKKFSQKDFKPTCTSESAENNYICSEPSIVDFVNCFVSFIVYRYHHLYFGRYETK